jgi:hypothetical protein
MRLFAIIFIGLLIGCSEGGSSTPTASRTAPATRASYSPSTFRSEVESLVREKRFDDAIALLKAASVEQQVSHDQNGYIGLGFEAVVFPGITAKVDYDPKRDWLMPGVSDDLSIGTEAWHIAARNFASAYNRRRHGVNG